MTTTPTPEIVPGAEAASSTATELAGLRSEVAGGLSPATNEALAMGVSAIPLLAVLGLTYVGMKTIITGKPPWKQNESIA